MSSPGDKGYPAHWPPLGPQHALEKLDMGKILSEGEMSKLREDAEASAALEVTDGNYARAARRWRAQFTEDRKIEETRRVLQDKAKSTVELRARAVEQRHKKRNAAAPGTAAAGTRSLTRSSQEPGDDLTARSADPSRSRHQPPHTTGVQPAGFLGVGRATRHRSRLTAHRAVRPRQSPWTSVTL